MVRRPGGRLGRGEQLDGLLGQHGRPLDEVQAADVLVARRAVAAGFREGATLQVVVAGGLRLEAGTDVGDDLLGLRAIRGVELLPLPEGVVVGLRGATPGRPPWRARPRAACRRCGRWAP